MEVLKFKVISSNTQYKKYSKILENLILSKFKTKNLNDEIALLYDYTYLCLSKLLGPSIIQL